MKSEIEVNTMEISIKPGTLVESIERESKVVLSVLREVREGIYEAICLYTEGTSGWYLYEVHDHCIIDLTNGKFKLFTGTVKLKNVV